LVVLSEIVSADQRSVSCLILAGIFLFFASSHSLTAFET
jgi:hypothetical protein